MCDGVCGITVSHSYVTAFTLMVCLLVLPSLYPGCHWAYCFHWIFQLVVCLYAFFLSFHGLTAYFFSVLKEKCIFSMQQLLFG